MWRSILIVFCLARSDTPIRILHTTYTFIWGLIYILFTWLLYKYTQYTYIYEGVLQWGECNSSETSFKTWALWHCHRGWMFHLKSTNSQFWAIQFRSGYNLRRCIRRLFRPGALLPVRRVLDLHIQVLHLDQISQPTQVRQWWATRPAQVQWLWREVCQCGADCVAKGEFIVKSWTNILKF